MKGILCRIRDRLNEWFSPDLVVFPEWFFQVSGLPVDLHVVGVVQSMRQCTYLGDILDYEQGSILALPLLEYFEGQRVEITVRVLE